MKDREHNTCPIVSALKAAWVGYKDNPTDAQNIIILAMKTVCVVAKNPLIASNMIADMCSKLSPDEAAQWTKGMEMYTCMDEEEVMGCTKEIMEIRKEVFKDGD